MRSSVRLFSAAFAAAFSFISIGCGGGGSSAPSKPQVSVAIAPVSATLFLLGKQSFRATVTGTTDTRVEFEVTGGGSTTTDGVYTAPQRSGDYWIRAWSVADPSKYATALIRVNGYQERVSDAGRTVDGYYEHTANLLTDGSVLIAGGYGSSGLHTYADRYIPGQSGVRTAARLILPRQQHASVVLPNGRVLLSGGFASLTPTNFFDPVFASTEIYNPATDTFLAGPQMNFARRKHTMTPLADGRVLVVGGISLHGHGFSANPQTEIYSPVDNRFVTTGRMNDPRWLHSATRLKDGRVLVTGGRPNNCQAGCPQDGLRTAEIYNPATGTWSATGSMHISRYGHSTHLLQDGRVLIIGGESTEDLGETDQVREVEIYDPATGNFSTFAHLQEGRGFHALAELHDGRLLIAGGYKNSGQPMYTTEILDPQTKTVKTGPEMREFRSGALAVKLESGEVLIVGGHNSGSAVPLLDLFL